MDDFTLSQLCYVFHKVNGGWSGWWITEDCNNKTLLGGIWAQTRTRYCTNPTPKYGGLTCEAVSKQTSTNITICPTRKTHKIIFSSLSQFIYFFILFVLINFLFPIYENKKYVL